MRLYRQVKPNPQKVRISAEDLHTDDPPSLFGGTFLAEQLKMPPKIPTTIYSNRNLIGQIMQTESPWSYHITASSRLDTVIESTTAALQLYANQGMKHETEIRSGSVLKKK